MATKDGSQTAMRASHEPDRPHLFVSCSSKLIQIKIAVTLYFDLASAFAFGFLAAPKTSVPSLETS